MRHAVVVVLALAPAIASADPKKLKAEFLCGIYVDGKITKPIAGGKVGKITDPIACALHLTDPDEPGHAVHVRTVRGNDEMSNETGSVNDDNKTKDFEIQLKPGVAFKPCQDFDIVAGIYDPGGRYTKTIKVVQGCPKPKPIKADLSCMTEAGDGTPLEFPKLKKLKGRLEKTMSCVIYTKSDAKLAGRVWVKGKAPHSADLYDTPPEGQKGELSLEPGTDFDVCSVKFQILGSLVDADGAERWTGNITIPAQFCPD